MFRSIIKGQVEGQIEMEQKHKEAIEKIMTEMDCPKDFQCYKSGFAKLCKAKRFLAGYADCLEENSQLCRFSVPSGDGLFCRCPLRVYVAENEVGSDFIN